MIYFTQNPPTTLATTMDSLIVKKNVWKENARDTNIRAKTRKRNAIENLLRTNENKKSKNLWTLIVSPTMDERLVEEAS